MASPGWHMAFAHTLIPILSAGALSCNTLLVDPCSRNPTTHSPVLVVDVQLFSTWPPKLTPGIHQPPEGTSPSWLQGEGWCRAPEQSSRQTHFSLHASPLLPSPGCHGLGCLILLSNPLEDLGSSGSVSLGAFRTSVEAQKALFSYPVTLTHKKVSFSKRTVLWLPKGRRVWERWSGSLHLQMQTTVYRMDRQGPTI